MTKHWKLKLEIKWNSYGIITWKPWEENSHKLWSKDTKLEDKDKGSIEGGIKDMSGPHIWYIYFSSRSYDH